MEFGRHAYGESLIRSLHLRGRGFVVRASTEASWLFHHRPSAVNPDPNLLSAPVVNVQALNPDRRDEADRSRKSLSDRGQWRFSRSLRSISNLFFTTETQRSGISRAKRPQSDGPRQSSRARKRGSLRKISPLVEMTKRVTWRSWRPIGGVYPELSRRAQGLARVNLRFGWPRATGKFAQGA